MNIEDKKMYSEVYSILNLLGEEYINKIPKKIINFVRKNRMNTYTPKYSFEEDLDKQNIKKDSLALIALLNFKYWTENEKEKREIYSLLKK
ncbi:MAG: hypothetical protein J6C46_05530 [Clostridia bacterium]|nr:hypothetical protein [Clostridia bacterium]